MATAIQEHRNAGAYAEVSDAAALAKLLTSHLQAVSNDKHLRLRYFPNGFPPRATSPVAEQRRRAEELESARRDNFGFRKVEHLPGNIGYVDFRIFLAPELASPAAAAAMNLLQHTDALIIDLRRNRGGDPAMVAEFCSYFFDRRTHLNDIYWRPSDSTTEYWTKEAVPGPRYGAAKPVYLLTSNYTFSGAEEFANNMKVLQRATIVGETTGGGAHPVEVFPINAQFAIAVPAGRAINPITKSNWEGVGVKPHREAPASMALGIAHKAALEQILNAATDPNRRKALQSALDELAKPPASN